MDRGRVALQLQQVVVGVDVDDQELVCHVADGDEWSLFRGRCGFGFAVHATVAGMAAVIEKYSSTT